jgi:hypothetical protein
MLSTGMFHRVALAGTDILEECSASIIRVTRISKLGTTIAVELFDVFVIVAGMISRFRKQYKNNSLPFTSVGRYKRAQKQLEDRHASRSEQLHRHCALSGLTDDTQSCRPTADIHKLRLQKWKEEKQKQEWLMETLQEPVFKCGVVHHKIGPLCYSYSCNINHLKHNKKASSTLARPEHPCPVTLHIQAT